MMENVIVSIVLLVFVGDASAAANGFLKDGIFGEDLEFLVHDNVGEVVLGLLEHLDPQGHDLELLHHMSLLLQHLQQLLDQPLFLAAINPGLVGLEGLGEERVGQAVSQEMGLLELLDEGVFLEEG